MNWLVPLMVTCVLLSEDCAPYHVTLGAVITAIGRVISVELAALLSPSSNGTFKLIQSTWGVAHGAGDKMTPPQVRTREFIKASLCRDGRVSDSEEVLQLRAVNQLERRIYCQKSLQVLCEPCSAELEVTAYYITNVTIIK